MITYRPAPFFRFLPVFGGFAFFAFAILGIFVGVAEDDALGLWFAGGSLLALGYFVFNGWQVAYTLTLQSDHLTIHRLAKGTTLRYEEITAVNLTQNTLILFAILDTQYPISNIANDSHKSTRFVLYGDPKGLAHLYAILQTRIPALKQEKETARTRGLPILHERDIRPDIVAGGSIAAVCVFLLFMLVWSQTAVPLEENWLASTVICGMSAILLPVGLLMIMTAIRRVTFSSEEISIQTVWRTQTYPVYALTDLQIKADERAIRGFLRTFYTLALTFDSDKTVEIPPTFSDSIGVRQEQACLELTDLRASLLNHYPMVTIEPPSNTFAEPNEWGKGWIHRIFHVKPYRLTVQEEDYGEVHRSVFSLHYVFSRPVVEGITRFRTVDGNLIYTPDGRYLILYDLAQFIVIDLQEECAYHRTVQRQGYLTGVRLDGNVLRSKLLSLGKPASQTEDLPPVPLDHLSVHLQPGTGTHPPGMLPTAGGTPRATPAPTPTDNVTALLARACAFGNHLPEEFETLRDDFAALGPGAFPSILDEARNTKDSALLELLVTVLVDSAYPPAFPDFVTWLDHPNDEIRFFCASALDQIAEKRFGIDKMIDRGWVQHDKIRAAIPSIKDWWIRGGVNRVPTMANWRKKASAPPIPDLHKWFNFVELNPWWVRFGDGVVAQKERGFILPRNQGLHVVGGQVWFPHAEPMFGAFVMDSGLGWVSEVYVKQEGKWVEVSEQMARAESNFRF